MYLFHRSVCCISVKCFCCQKECLKIKGCSWLTFKTFWLKMSKAWPELELMNHVPKACQSAGLSLHLTICAFTAMRKLCLYKIYGWHTSLIYFTSSTVEFSFEGFVFFLPIIQLILIIQTSSGLTSPRCPDWISCHPKLSMGGCE